MKDMQLAIITVWIYPPRFRFLTGRSGNMKRNNVKYIGQCLKEMSRIFEFSRRRLPEIPPRMVLPLPGHAVILGTKLTVAVVIMALIFSLFYQIIR
ncbi:uncharacterized protein LOC118184917 isoform X2 [Stegodyphus dumicola]|uniref:uncharacterized protein LOC118184917 isoform X2 n=1 Tax=Stegodyphus dumicola TaxID=202533 RepID=UPI0015ADA4F7|nr:uncharacterized protein LOC118184917 isoform X2 [Stegodyphus dumicola]